MSRLKVLLFGEDDRVINPGDLLIVSESSLNSGLTNSVTNFELVVQGRDVALFLEAAQKASDMWDANKEWLAAPVSGPKAVSTRGIAGISQLPPPSADRMGELLGRIKKQA